MSTAVLHPDSQAFPPGTVVKVYAQAEPETPGPYAGEPRGAKLGEATVANAGTLEVTGATEGLQYIGWSQRSGVDYYLRFRVDVATGGGATGTAGGDLEGSYPNPTLASGVVAPAELAANAVEAAAIAAGAVGTAALAAGAVTAPKLGAEAVETAAIKNLNVTGAKLAAKTIEKSNLTTKAIEELSGTGGPPSGAASGVLAGEYPAPTLKAEGVETAAIKNLNVTAAKLAAEAVTAPKLGAEAVETAAIKAANVTTAKIANAAITPTQLAANAVEAAAIAAGAVIAAKIGTGAVETAKLAASAVTTEKLAAASVEESKLSAGVIAKWATTLAEAEAASSPRVKVKATAVTAGQAAPYNELLRVDATAGALTITLPEAAGHTGQFVMIQKTDASANEVLIEGEVEGTAATVLKLRLQTEVTKLVAGATGGWYREGKYLAVATLDARYIRALAEEVTESELKAAAVVATKIAGEAVTAAKLASEAVETAKIKAEAVTAAKLATGAVTNTKLGAEAVSEAKLATGAVSATKLGAEAVEAAAIATNAVTSAKINAEAVTAAKLASEAVTAAKLGAEAVETAKIKLLNITTGLLAAEAVTAAKRTKITLEVTRTFAIAGTVAVEKYPGFFIGSTGWSITRIDYEVLGGTSTTFQLLDNGTAVTEYKELKAEKSHGEKATTVALTSGHKIDLEATATNGGKGLAVSVTLQKEV